jgi:hypothetical protein
MVIGEGTAQAFRRLVGMLYGEPGQGGQALVDGVLALFDKAVGEEDEGSAAGELPVAVRAGGTRVDAERQPRLGIEVPRLLPGHKQQRGRVAGEAATQAPPEAGRPETGKTGGRERQAARDRRLCWRADRVIGTP